MNITPLPSRALAAKFVALFAICSGAFVTADQTKANIITNASDNAGNYSGGWTNGANGGTGFGAWNIILFNGTNTNTPGFAGAFVGNPAGAGITGMETNAFALYANPTGSGAYATAERGVNIPLSIGQTLSFQWGINWDSGSGGNKGFNLVASGSEVINVNNAGTNLITLNGTSMGSGYGTNAMTWNFTRTAANILTVVANKRDGSGTYSNDIVVANGAVSALKFYASDMQAGDSAQPYFNNLQIAGPAPTTITNQVTFSVNMAYQASQGLFSSNSDTVQLRSSFDNWSTNNQLINQGNNIFSGTFNVTGNEGSAVEYIFWNSSPLATNFGYETTGNRSLTLGTAGASTNLPTVFFSNLAGQRFVTFSVNMAIQQGKGVFNPAVNTNVQVRGDFNGWAGNQLTNQGGSVYSGTFLLSSSATNSILLYKFNYMSGTNIVWESLGGDRSSPLVLNGNGSNAPALALATNFFGNELFYASPNSLAGYLTTQGTASAAQTTALFGQGLSANIVATAPTVDWQVSTNGTDYASTVEIAPAAGLVSAATLYVRATGAAQGLLSNNILLTSSNSATSTISVMGTVGASTNGYNSWLLNYPSLTGANTNGNADPDGDGFVNNIEYAFGGNPTTGTPAMMTATQAGTNAVFRWVERNSGVAYQVQKNGTLTNSWSNAVGLVISNSSDTNGVLLPAEYIRREFVVPASGKEFYRVQSTTVPMFGFVMVGPSDEDAPNQIGLTSLAGNRVYYNSKPGNSTDYVAMLPKINGQLVANISFTVDRLGMQFGYSLSGTSCTHVGIFTDGFVDLQPIK